MISIHPLAHVSSGAVLGDETSVAPFAVIETGVVTGAGCAIGVGVVLHPGTTLGDRVRVHPYAVLGGLPQDYSFDPAVASGVAIGDDTVIREGVTVNRASKPGTVTRVGKNSMLMASSHVAHDATLGDHVTLANSALIAGHVTVGDRAFVSGNTSVHQFNRIGPGAMVAAGATITLDVPPYTMTAERNHLIGFNLVGLRRAGTSRESISELKRVWRAVYAPGAMNACDNARRALDSGVFISPEALIFLRFFAEPGRRHGHARPRSAAEQEN